MKTIQQNIEALEVAKQQVKDHPMCAKLKEEKDRVVVFFPRGFQVDAAQMRYASEGVSKTKAYELLLGTMEKYWKIS